MSTGFGRPLYRLSDSKCFFAGFTEPRDELAIRTKIYGICLTTQFVRVVVGFLLVHPIIRVADSPVQPRYVVQNGSRQAHRLAHATALMALQRALRCFGDTNISITHIGDSFTLG